MATFVLIHGAGGDGRYWHLLEPELRERGHDVVTMDLPCEDDSATFEDYADVVAEAIGDRRNVVLVAQSLAGFTAPLVCRRVSVDLMVMLTAMIPLPGERAADWWGNTGLEEAQREQRRRDGLPVEDGDAFDLEYYFFHDVAPEITAVAMGGGRDQSGAPMEAPLALDSWPEVATKAIVCRDDRFFPAVFMRRVVRERLGIEPDEIEGGHLTALSRAKELAEMLDGYVRDR